MAATPTRLVIVESPTKATRIASFLGKGYTVESSRGHVRDLPQKAADIPAKYKGEKWARTAVNVEDDFAPIYVVSADKRATIKSLKEKLKTADELLLATDEDREGEAIAWHLLAELKPKVPVKRMVFHEITEQAIAEAVANPRDIDMDLVDAQETRRILDRLYGWEISPVLWKKVMPKLSAGRVQSVATRLVVDRERERMAFIPAGWWGLDATLDAGEGAKPRQFAARLTKLDGTSLATGNDFDDRGELKGNAVVLGEADAQKLAAALGNAPFTVVSVDAKSYNPGPQPPFRTTTLQREASTKLGFTAQRTMSVAQSLYEGGYITYMRTDSTALSGQAIAAARTQIVQLYGADYVPAKPRTFANNVKNAQEAHEAIRPAGERFRTPDQTGLYGDELKLYDMIWRRTLASQMVNAQGQSVSVRLEAKPAQRVQLDGLGAAVTTATFAASGRTITFPGYMKVYTASSEEEGNAENPRLPQLKPDQVVTAEEVAAKGHTTNPRARYTEATLIEELEKREIGRPSTYASIIRTITDRDYVFKKGTALVPTWLAFAVTSLLEKHFADLVDYDFTAQLEDRLDDIARGDSERLAVLKAFYYGNDDVDGLESLVNNLGDIDARGLSTFDIGTDEHPIRVRVGRYGTYVEDDEGRRANVPDDLPPAELTSELALEYLSHPVGEERELGIDPATETMIVAKTGRFGPYVTEVLDVDPDAKKKPKARTASLFKDMSLETITLEQALQLLSLPRVVGVDDDGAEITAQNGPYGPYLKKGTDSRSIDTEDQLFTITLDEAKAIYAAPKQRRGRAAASALRELGVDPNSGKPMVIKSGRFGPYITDGEFNVTVPKSEQVETITPERATELLAEKRAKGPAPKRTTRRTTTKRTTTKRATTTRTKKA